MNKKFFFNAPVHTLLLPLFFVLHIYIEYIEMVNASAAVYVCFKLVVASILIYISLRLSTKNRTKSGIITTFFMAIWLFFGNIKKTLSDFHLPASYSVILPFLAIVMIIVVVIILRGKSVTRLNIYLNLLLSIFVITDTFRLFFQHVGGAYTQSLFNDQYIIDKHNNVARIVKPDIYYILFDTYPNINLLRSYQPANSFFLDSFLIEKKFHVVPKSISNYNNTVFSMNATFNMLYLQKLNNPDKEKPPVYSLSALEYNKALLDINRASVFKYFTEQDYTIYNLSIFKLNNQPPMLKENFLTATPQDVFLFNTLGKSISRDILWNLKVLLHKYFQDNSVYEFMHYMKIDNDDKLTFNQRVLDSLPTIADDRNEHPRLVYAHLYMPHYPFFYDSNGNKYDDTVLYAPGAIYDRAKFLGYVDYTNKRIKLLTDGLLKATAGKAVIIIESDHGYLGFAVQHGENNFRNLEAIYFPDQDYTLLYDSLSNVNTFRIVLKKYFKEPISLLRDSSITLLH